MNIPRIENLLRLDRLASWGSMAWFNRESFTHDELSTLRRLLTLESRGFGTFKEPENIETFLETDALFGVPRALARRCMDMSFSESVRPEVEATFKFIGILRDYQVEPVDDVIQALLRIRGGILQARAGSGKTVMALRIIEAMGVRTLVLVHKEFLMDQWMERITSYLPGTKIGRVQGDTFNLQPITLAMVQSVVTREYPELWNWPGLVISDECHRIAAPTWSQVIKLLNSEYRLGLSATPTRKDGLEDIFLWNLGPILTIVTEGQMKAHVYRLSTGLRVNEGMVNKEDKSSNVKLLRQLSENEHRNQLIGKATRDALKSGRKVLVLSHFRDHANDIRLRCDGGDWSVGMYMGGSSREDLRLAAQCQLIIGTYKMAEEALDIQALDTLMLATPISSIEQATGRILRRLEGKKQPIILDPVDEGPIVDRWAEDRLHEYRRLGYDVRWGRLDA